RNAKSGSGTGEGNSEETRRGDSLRRSARRRKCCQKIFIRRFKGGWSKVSGEGAVAAYLRFAAGIGDQAGEFAAASGPFRIPRILSLRLRTKQRGWTAGRIPGSGRRRKIQAGKRG